MHSNNFSKRSLINLIFFPHYKCAKSQKLLKHNVSTLGLYSRGREFKSSDIHINLIILFFQEPIGIGSFKTLIIGSKTL
jgi:hypothetical protein